MEIRIGIRHCAREITIESEQAPEQVEATVEKALQENTSLRLVDSKGAIVIVPQSSLGYIEIGAPRRGGVGFGKI